MRFLYDVPAPAKLNLFLHITGRRADGYHLLQSVFMLIDWCDTLHFELCDSAGITREDIGAVLPADDLTVRAARLLQESAGCGQGVHITVEKRIPAQAGMGGGSSDAATCLLALNRLWHLGLTGAQLEVLGLRLGADIPFFLRGRNAWVEGTGERIAPLEGASRLPRARFLVVKPSAGLATDAIFSAEDLKRNTGTARIAGFAAEHYGFGHNDLQPVAQRLCPEVTQALQWLADQGLSGRMTGSGSAVFAPMRQAPRADAVVPDGWQARVCSNLDIHPLAGWAPSDVSVGGF